MLNTPEQKDQLSQILYGLAAQTRIELKIDELSPTLYDCKVHAGEQGSEVLELGLHVDVRSPDAMRAAAAQVREIAVRIDAAAGAELPERQRFEDTLFALWVPKPDRGALFKRKGDGYEDPQVDGMWRGFMVAANMRTAAEPIR